MRALSAVAAVLFMTMFPASPSFAEILEQAMQQCAALTNSARRLTCYDLLAQLRVTEPSNTTARDEVRVHYVLMSKLDAWIANQPAPTPSWAEALRRLLTTEGIRPGDPALMSFVTLILQERQNTQSK
jgi:hypothetical protein